MFQIAAIKKLLKRKMRPQDSMATSDPYIYGSGLDVDDSDTDTAPPAGPPAPRDQDDDIEASDDDIRFDNDDVDADDDLSDDDNSKRTPGRWVEEGEGWRSWKEDDERFETPVSGNQLPSAAAYVTGTKDINDATLDQFLQKGGSPVRQFHRDLIGQQRLFDAAYNWTINKPHRNSRDVAQLEKLREQGLRLKRLFDRVKLAETPDGVRHRTPRSPRSVDFRLDASPVQQRKAWGPLHGRQLDFGDDDEADGDDDDAPISARTRRHGPVPEDGPKQDK